MCSHHLRAQVCRECQYSHEDTAEGSESEGWWGVDLGTLSSWNQINIHRWILIPEKTVWEHLRVQFKPYKHTQVLWNQVRTFHSLCSDVFWRRRRLQLLRLHRVSLEDLLSCLMLQCLEAEMKRSSTTNRAECSLWGSQRRLQGNTRLTRLNGSLWDPRQRRKNTDRGSKRGAPLESRDSSAIVLKMPSITSSADLIYMLLRSINHLKPAGEFRDICCTWSAATAVTKRTLSESELSESEEKLHFCSHNRKFWLKVRAHRYSAGWGSDRRWKTQKLTSVCTHVHGAAGVWLTSCGSLKELPRSEV